MSSNGGLSASYVIMFSLAVSGAFFAMFGHLLPGVGNLLSSSLGQAARQQISTLFAQPSNNEVHEYQTQIFSRDPLIVYIRNFVSSDEIDYLLQTRYVAHVTLSSVSSTKI
jgi:prolyl 4-hydroxylase